MKKRLRIQPLDPLMIRDGRPFDPTPGVRAKTLKEPLPSVMAGAVRTMMAKRRKAHVDTATKMNHFAQVSVYGPLYRWKDQIYFPMPQDMELYNNDSGELGLLPVTPHESSLGQNLQGVYGVGRDGRLMDHLWLPLGSGMHKPLENAPAYMSEKWMLKWLTQSYDKRELLEALNRWHGSIIKKPAKEKIPSDNLSSAFLSAFPRQERTHVEIDVATRRAKDQRLYSTEYLQLPDDVSMEVEVSMPEEEWQLSARFQTSIRLVGNGVLLIFPKSIKEKLGPVRRKSQIV